MDQNLRISKCLNPNDNKSLNTIFQSSPLAQSNNNLFSNLYSSQRANGDSPASSLAADLSVNFHIDADYFNTIPTPRRSLLSTLSSHISPHHPQNNVPPNQQNNLQNLKENQTLHQFSRSPILSSIKQNDTDLMDTSMDIDDLDIDSQNLSIPSKSQSTSFRSPLQQIFNSNTAHLSSNSHSRASFQKNLFKNLNLENDENSIHNHNPSQSNKQIFNNFDFNSNSSFDTPTQMKSYSMSHAFNNFHTHSHSHPNSQSKSQSQSQSQSQSSNIIHNFIQDENLSPNETLDLSNTNEDEDIDITEADDTFNNQRFSNYQTQNNSIDITIDDYDQDQNLDDFSLDNNEMEEISIAAVFAENEKSPEPLSLPSRKRDAPIQTPISSRCKSTQISHQNLILNSTSSSNSKDFNSFTNDSTKSNTSHSNESSLDSVNKFHLSRVSTSSLYNMKSPGENNDEALKNLNDKNSSKFRRTQSMFQHPKDVLASEMQNSSSPLSNSDQSSSTLPSITLPCDPMKRIDSLTLLKVIDGEYDHEYDQVYIIDCRFEYEYDGGHIDGAININTKEQLEKKFFSNPIEGNSLLIFHCEYSAHRAPLMAMHLRNEDRNINMKNYPKLSYPEVYVLLGGYSNFYQLHRSRCQPQCYVEMNHENHIRTCEREMSRFRRAMKFGRSFSSLSTFNTSNTKSNTISKSNTTSNSGFTSDSFFLTLDNMKNRYNDNTIPQDDDSPCVNSSTRSLSYASYSPLTTTLSFSKSKPFDDLNDASNHNSFSPSLKINSLHGGNKLNQNRKLDLTFKGKTNSLFSSLPDLQPQGHQIPTQPHFSFGRSISYSASQYNDCETTPTGPPRNARGQRKFV